ncbi:ER-derived vesicles protein ERV41 [Cyberlindnera fabianii]|uniref:Endoplasmic reticulum-Golgi intermediate compartment protein n=1 Tax=Cyberlindnera fabianii TaxID=36022 RepID=A0A1V2LAG1_CYBFA|nr:ER-derived vesicles protein ERV41 [Cyberlindnera fabianii]
MSSRMSSLKTFDAFPKVASTHTVRSTRGSYNTIFTFLCLLFLTWAEIGSFFGGRIDHQFVVDNTVSQNLTINVDILIAMPCNFLHTNVRDLTDDRFLAAEALKYEGFSFFIPPSYRVNDDKSVTTPDLNEIMAEGIVAQFMDRGDHKQSGHPACHIYGSIPVTKVSGDFHITAKGYGYRDRAHVDIEALNFTHVISEFSFGQFYPYINNPLDATARWFQRNIISSVQKLIQTNTLCHYKKKTYSLENRGIPGIFFKYDFEPITMIVEDKRIPFLQWLVRLATIYGGVIVAAQWSMKALDNLLILFYGKKFASRGSEKSSSLLDGDKNDE